MQLDAGTPEGTGGGGNCPPVFGRSVKPSNSNKGEGQIMPTTLLFPHPPSQFFERFATSVMHNILLMANVCYIKRI